MSHTSLKLVMIGTIPSKKNNKIAKVNKAGKAYLTTSAQFKKWYRLAAEVVDAWLIQQKELHPNLSFPIVDRVAMNVKFYFGDLRSRDLSNKMDTIQDLLVDRKVLYDDSYFILQKIGATGETLPRKKSTRKRIIRTRTEIYITVYP